MHIEDGCECGFPFDPTQVDRDRSLEVRRRGDDIGSRNPGKHAHDVLQGLVFDGHVNQLHACRSVKASDVIMEKRDNILTVC